MPAAHLSQSVREELRLVALREILRATAAALPLREILAIVANMAIIAFDATIAWIMRAEEGQLRTVVACGVHAEDLARVALTTRSSLRKSSGVDRLMQAMPGPKPRRSTRRCTGSCSRRPGYR
jgi:hypothetical protein